MLRIGLMSRWFLPSTHWTRTPTRALALWLLCLMAFATGCRTLRQALDPSPREQYAQRLRDSGLAEAALARDWTAAGDAALANPFTIRSPFRETGYFAPSAASAVAYQLDLARGRRLVVDVQFESASPGRLFVDLFRQPEEPTAAAERVASLADGTTSIEYAVERDGVYSVLVQPELLRGGRFTLIERTLASLPLPVQGVTAAALQSVFGAARDAGRRQHEGVDIFAPRGTPVLAVVDGTARRDTNTLGGNVVWLRTPARQCGKVLLPPRP